MPKETKDIEEGPISTELDGAMLPTNPIRRIAIVGAGSADCGIAKAVARQARMEGQCEPFGDEELAGLIARKLWEPSNGRIAGDCRPEC